MHLVNLHFGKEAFRKDPFSQSISLIKGFIQVKSLVCVVFTHNSHLAKHKKIHLCEICQKSFNVRASFASHNESAAHLKQNEKKE